MLLCREKCQVVLVHPRPRDIWSRGNNGNVKRMCPDGSDNPKTLWTSRLAFFPPPPSSEGTRGFLPTNAGGAVLYALARLPYINCVRRSRATPPPQPSMRGCGDRCRRWIAPTLNPSHWSSVSSWWTQHGSQQVLMQRRHAPTVASAGMTCQVYLISTHHFA